MPLTRLPAANRTATVVDQLSAAILGGDVPVGQPLPPERQLAEQLGVSRNVLREATKILQSRGLVAVRQGVGTIVLGLSSEPVQRVLSSALERCEDPLLQLIEVRLSLEVETAGLAAQRRTSADLDQMEDLLQRFEAAMDQNALEECAALDVAFHQAVARATRNEVFVLMLDSVSGLLLENRKRALRNSRLEIAADHHRAIYKAIKAGSADSAAAQMRRHLETSRWETQARGTPELAPLQP